MEHPRWGATQGVRLTKNVMAGEELLAHYGYIQYNIVPNDFPWYWELKRKVEKDERLSEKTLGANSRKSKQ